MTGFTWYFCTNLSACNRYGCRSRIIQIHDTDVIWVGVCAMHISWKMSSCVFVFIYRYTHTPSLVIVYYSSMLHVAFAHTLQNATWCDWHLFQSRFDVFLNMGLVPRDKTTTVWMSGCHDCANRIDAEEHDASVPQWLKWVLKCILLVEMDGFPKGRLSRFSAFKLKSVSGRFKPSRRIGFISSFRSNGGTFTARCDVISICSKCVCVGLFDFTNCCKSICLTGV